MRQICLILCECVELFFGFALLTCQKHGIHHDDMHDRQRIRFWPVKVHDLGNSRRQVLQTMRDHHNLLVDFQSSLRLGESHSLPVPTPSFVAESLFLQKLAAASPPKIPKFDDMT